MLCAQALLARLFLVSRWVWHLIGATNLKDLYLWVNFWKRVLEPGLPEVDTLKERRSLFELRIRQKLLWGTFRQ
jgi:hypothetical protein